jgi:cytochrome c biogenesis protein CcdA
MAEPGHQRIDVGYPVIGALHVLALAFVSAAVVVPFLRQESRWIRWTGLILVVVTGALLFAAGAEHYYASTAFRIKLALLTLLAFNAIASRPHRIKLHNTITLALWAAAIFASRGIAFF